MPIRTHWILVSGLLLIVLAGCGAREKAAAAELPQGAPEGILVIVIGGTAAGDSASDTMRALASGNADAVLFERHYVTAPTTSASLRSLLTGYPFESESEEPVRPNLAELFSRVGYRTFALVAATDVDSDLSRGFGDWSDKLDAADPMPQLAQAITQTDEAFVGLVFLPDAASADAVLAGLDGLPGYDRTLVVLTSDHGVVDVEASVERQFRETVIHVPLVVKFPVGGKPETVPSRSTSITSSVDVLPSLLALVGKDISGALPGSNVLDGYFSGFAFAANDEGWAFLQDNHKVVVSGAKAWVFDLAEDPQEQRDLATTAPDRARALLRLAVETRELLSRDAVTDVGEEMDEETLEHLRSLGYIQ